MKYLDGILPTVLIKSKLDNLEEISLEFFVSAIMHKIKLNHLKSKL